MKTLIRAAFAVFTLGVGAAHGQAAQYHAPANNYYQNNWMSSAWIFQASPAEGGA